MGPKCVSRERSQDGRIQPLTGHIADDQGDQITTQLEDVVEIATDSRLIPRG